LNVLLQITNKTGLQKSAEMDRSLDETLEVRSEPFSINIHEEKKIYFDGSKKNVLTL
jgi:hypothetical protein